MISVFVLTFNNYAVAFNLDILRIRNNGNIEVFGNLRTYLCGISIDRLTACDNQIILQISECAGNCCGSSPCISAAKHSVRYKDTLVGTHCHRFTKNLFRFRKTHGYNCNLCAIFIF